MATTIQIRSLSGAVLFSHEQEDNTLKKTMEVFLKANRGKIISDADLSGIDITGLTFYNTTFYNTTFYNSCFDNSRFKNSRFNTSRFNDCSLCYTTFANSVFSNCNFFCSNFFYSNFHNSNFKSNHFHNSPFDNCRFDKKTIFSNAMLENIRKAGQLNMFDHFKHDLWTKVLIQKCDVRALREKIVSGRIYENEGYCFAGTLANATDCDFASLKFNTDSSSPVENWFVMLKRGYTPETNELVKLTVEWIDELLIHLKS